MPQNMASIKTYLSALRIVIPATGVLAKPLAVWWGGKAGMT